MIVRKFIFVLFLLSISYLLLVTDIFAKEITLIYTGETHAMLYPCNCPREPDGGIARRSTLLRQLRKNNPYTLVLDSGGFFAGGLMDEYTQNTTLDMQRTLVNLQAMELMQYDAVTVGDDEFNFGREFLQENAAKTKIAFLSCNLKSELLKSYLIKDFGGTKIGIIGVTSPSVVNKAVGLDFIEPKTAVRQTIAELKKNGAGIIVLLSHLGEVEDLKLINDISGIDVLITGHSLTKEGPCEKKGATIILRPSWQGRRLDKISLAVKDNKIINYKVEELRLSDKISDDPKMLSVLPRCFRDADCKKEGIIGKCEKPATLSARCSFRAAAKINLLIIAPRQCISCDTENIIKQLKAAVGGLVVSYLYYPDTKANKLIKDLGINGLPVYLLSKEIEKEKSFDNLKNKLEARGDFYLLKPQFSGISYFIERKKIKGALDLFVSLYAKDTAQLLDAIKDFRPNVHFLAIEQKDTFDAAVGQAEVEEYLRSVCVQKYYPEYFWNYIGCRVKSIHSSWWEDCLGNFDSYKIRTCAKGEEGKLLLRENIRLNKEIEVMYGPTYLLDNQEIFSTEGIPTKEGFKRILKR